MELHDNVFNPIISHLYNWPSQEKYLTRDQFFSALQVFQREILIVEGKSFGLLAFFLISSPLSWRINTFTDTLFLIDRRFMLNAQPSRSAADALRRSLSSSILTANVSESSAPKDFPPTIKYST